ncbi:MAG TPA: type II toxin-antitoxin system VapC family toxin [Thermoanaerobaculia bacterium]|nr:type II toxin-antitoxin system VapC family toxin [Thermoanaerobaculia bacterium]
MSYLLDTNSWIRFLNRRSEAVRRRLEALRPEEVAICSVVKAELFYGAAKSARPVENLARIRSLDRFVSLPFDDAAAQHYGAIRARLERAGKVIGPNDLLIAAIALAHQATLVTHNTREFGRIEELRLEDWES